MLRYITELQFDDIEVDFANAIPIIVNDQSQNFDFRQIDKLKEKEKIAEVASMMGVRATFEDEVRFGDLDKGLFNTSVKWSINQYAILTNIGFMRFGKDGVFDAPYQTIYLKQLHFEATSNHMEGHSHLLSIYN